MPAPARPETGSDLNSLVDAVRSTVRCGLPAADTADRVSRDLQRWLATEPELPERYRASDPEHYVQHVVHTEPDGSFSIVALVWLPGQCTPIHDHVSWCVTGVYLGEEQEQRYELRGSAENPHLVPVDEVVNPVGSVCGFAPPGDIHQVHNSCDVLSVSLHIYGADISELGSSIRRSYSDPVVTAGSGSPTDA